MKKIKRKLLLTSFATSVFASIPLTVISCSSTAISGATKTEEQVKKEDYLSNYAKGIIIGKYYNTINNDIFKNDYKRQAKKMFEYYAKWKEAENPGYWASQMSSMIDGNGLKDMKISDEAKSGKVNAIIKLFNETIELSNTTTKPDKILLNNWFLEIDKLLLEKAYFEYTGKSSIKKYWNISSDDQSKQNGYIESDYPILTKWIKENKPYFLWQINNKNPIYQPVLTNPMTKNNWNSLIHNYDEMNKIVKASWLDNDSDKYSGYIGMKKDNNQIPEELRKKNGFEYNDKDATKFTNTIDTIKFITKDGKNTNIASWYKKSIYRYAMIHAKATMQTINGVETYKYSLPNLSNDLREKLIYNIVLEHGQINVAKKFFNKIGYKMSSTVPIINDLLKEEGDVTEVQNNS